jgi:hypothetical protein
MAKYRKKPVVVGAEQWFKLGNVEEVKEYDWCKEFNKNELVVIERCGNILCKHCGGYLKNHGWIDTLEGGHLVCPGDWIITGVKGEKYPCKPDIFEQTYEKVG